MVITDNDIESLGLALRLQLEELEEIKDKKGKAREGELSDAQHAIQSYESELAIQQQLLSDLAMSRSIAQAVASDFEIVNLITAEEDQATNDRRVAISLGQGGPIVDSTVGDLPMTMALPDEATLEKLAALNNYATADEYSLPSDQLPVVAESSAWAASRPSRSSRPHPTSMVKPVKCDSCHDRFSPGTLADCSCQHKYCRECLTTLFRSSLADESLFPPRCCRQHIPLDSALLSPQLIGQFRAKELEFGTQNRTYCHEPACSTFVPAQFIRDDVAICVKCSTRTCVICKGSTHAGDCPLDTEAQEMIQFAAANGWQRCHSCRRLVDLAMGCNHMTCTCRAEFCYVCGLQWKTCKCAAWDEEHLLVRANVIVDREAQAGPVNQRNRAQRVERARAGLLQRHECDHQRWKSRDGPEQCEECNDVLPMFIYECVQCNILACRRCRYHRL